MKESPLIDAAVAWLRERLPGSWTVARAQQAPAESPISDAAIDIGSQHGGFARLVVEARGELAPRDVERLLSGLTRSLRAVASHVPILVVAPWLSARTRELLAAEEINYLDLTGNALIRLEHPTLYLRADGAGRNPAPQVKRGPARARGPKAGRLLRLLADVQPPYGVQEIALATGLTPGYVSRLLDALDREALIERDLRGPVRSVDVAALLRRWAESYDVLASNAPATFLAQNGAAGALERLAWLEGVGRTLVTGSFAAVRKAPVAAPALLAVYCDDVDLVARELGLLPADSGANVVLLRPFDQVVWSQGDQDEGMAYAAVSQVAVDCLTGNGRMPAEGEALLSWMAENEDRWRASSLQELGEIGGSQ